MKKNKFLIIALSFSAVIFASSFVAVSADDYDKDYDSAQEDYDKDYDKDYDRDHGKDYGKSKKEDYDKDYDRDKKSENVKKSSTEKKKDYDKDYDYDYDKDYDKGDKLKVKGRTVKKAVPVAGRAVGRDYSEDYAKDYTKDYAKDYAAYEGYSNGREEKTRQVVQNPDGTVTEIIREREKDGTIEVKYILRDKDGNILEKREGEYDPKEGEEEMKVTTYDVYGKKLREVKIETQDGKVVEVKVKEDSGASRVKYDVESRTLEIRSRGTYKGDEEAEETYDKVIIRAVGDDFVLTRKGAGVKVNYPLTVDNETGDISVKTPIGEVTLKAMPDTIVQTVRDRNGLDVVESVDLVSDNGLQYVVSGKRQEKLLGLFDVEIPLEVKFDAATGTFRSVEQGFWSKALDLLSF